METDFWKQDSQVQFFAANMIYSKICQEMVDLPVQQIQVLNMIGGAVSEV